MIWANTSDGAAEKTADGAATGQPTSLQKDLPTKEKIPTHWCDENINFLVQNIFDWELPKADIVVASGMLTFNVPDNKDNIEHIIQKLFSYADETLALNFMSSYVDFELDKNLHFAPEKIFSYAKKNTNWVNIYHDYPLYEFTIQLNKKASCGY